MEGQLLYINATDYTQDTLNDSVVASFSILYCKNSAKDLMLEGSSV